MKIAEEQRPDGSTRYRVQHRDPQRPGKYTTLRFDDKRDAAEFVRRAKTELHSALEWEQERRAGAKYRGEAARTFIDYARDFVAARTDAKEHSKRAYTSQLRAIAQVESFASMPLGAITTVDVERFKQELKALPTRSGEPRKAQTVNAILDLVFSAIRRAAALGQIPRDVTIGVRKFAVTQTKTPCPITVQEFDSILVHIPQKHRALFRFLLDSGLRISEALSLEWSDITETRNGIYEVRVYANNAADGKTRHAQRISTIPPETFKAMWENADTSERVFPLSYRTAAALWRTAVQRAQSAAHESAEFPLLRKHPTIHDLRHSHAAYLLLRCGFNLANVAERLGHRDIAVTQKYYGRMVTEQAHELGVHIARSIPRSSVI